MEMTTAESEMIRDFPSIIKENDSEVLARLVTAHDKESGANSQDEVSPVKIKGKKAKVVIESEVTAEKDKQQKVAKRKRRKAKTAISKEQAGKALVEMEEEELEPKKRKQEPIVCPMVEVTPDLAKMASDHAGKMLAE
jgi:hypothetical protein